MSIGYTWVQWSKHKRIYDAIATGAVLLYLAGFIAVSKLIWKNEESISDEVLLIRATGSCSLVLLHVILCIGPLARLDKRFLPVLHNRRHLGVLTFLIALLHGVVVTGYYHGFGVVNPLVSLLTTNSNFLTFRAFPFQVLGVTALAIMFVMAATSHDFWLRNLSARVWKRIHMLVYAAYALLIGHVALGALQNDRGALAPAAIVTGALVVGALHVLAGRREVTKDLGSPTTSSDAQAWIDVGAPADIPPDRARTVCAPGGERIAVFRHGQMISAITNVCAHQGGPLGEGKIIDGCVTCPWHGWQYRPQDGCSPPPFTEKIATYPVRIVGGRVQVQTTGLAPGTATAPARIAEVPDA